jgi:hypothetical protein
MLRGHTILRLYLPPARNGKLKRLGGTRAAVFAAGVDGVDHRRCFQFTDALPSSTSTTLTVTRPPPPSLNPTT